MRSASTLSIVLVVVDSERKWLNAVLQSIAAQRDIGIELVLVDNTSLQDVSVEISGAISQVRIIRNTIRPSWFVANNNLGIRECTGDIVLLLNTDALLEDDYCRTIAAAFAKREEVGIVSGKLLRMGPDGRPVTPPRFDSAGMLLTLGQRHIDRGSETLDRGQYNKAEYVFGATGAALAMRRRALQDLSTEGYCLDTDFVHGREDAELCLRAQLLGWRCWYEPSAVGYHLRTTRDGGRQQIPAWLRCEHVKDRFLLRFHDVPLPILLVLSPIWLFRDLQVLVYVLAKERTSLSAFRSLWRQRRQIAEKRRRLMQRRKASSRYMANLFFGGMQDLLYRLRWTLGAAGRGDKAMMSRLTAERP